VSSANGEHRWKTVGHDAAVATIAAAVTAGRVPHAWLVTGPEGVGRTTLALDLAASLNCESDQPTPPCGLCASCRRIQSRSHPDVLVADMAWQATMVPPTTGDRGRTRTRFSIDSVRALRADIVTRPMLGRWKLQILDDAGLFGEEAPEAFLKTLEEPPPFAVIVLVATSPDQVRDTIRSRCRNVELGLVARADIEAELLRLGADATRAALLARIARGRIAWAIDALTMPDLVTKRREALEGAFEHMATPLGRAAICGVVAAGHTQDRARTQGLLDLWLGLWRDALYLRSGPEGATNFPEVTDRLVSWSEPFSLGELRRAMESTRRCMNDLDTNVNARIALQAMVAQWPG